MSEPDPEAPETTPEKRSPSFVQRFKLMRDTFWLWLTTTRRSSFSVAEGIATETEYNAPRGAATLAAFISALATVILAGATFFMVCQARQSTEAAHAANALARRQAQSRLSLTVQDRNQRTLVKDGQAWRLDVYCYVEDASAVASHRVSRYISRTKHPGSVFADTRDTLVRLLRSVPTESQSSMDFSQQFTIRDTVQDDTLRDEEPVSYYWHICFFFTARGDNRVNYLEETYTVDYGQGMESAKFVQAGEPIRGYLDGLRLVIER